MIREHGNYRWAGLYDVALERGLVSNVAWSRYGPPEYPVFPVSKGLTPRAIASGKTVNLGNVAADEDYLTALFTTQSELIVPITDVAGRVIGTLDVESDHPNAFGLPEQAWLESRAGEITGLLEQKGEQ